MGNARVRTRDVVIGALVGLAALWGCSPVSLDTDCTTAADCLNPALDCCTPDGSCLPLGDPECPGPDSPPAAARPAVPLGALLRGVVRTGLEALVGYEAPTDITFSLTPTAAGANAEYRVTFTTAAGQPETFRTVLRFPGFGFNGFTALGPAGTEVGSYGVDVDRDGTADVTAPIRAVDANTAYVDRNNDGFQSPVDPTIVYTPPDSFTATLPRGGDARGSTMTTPITSGKIVTLRAGVLRNPDTAGPVMVSVSLTSVDPESGDADNQAGEAPGTFALNPMVEITAPVCDGLADQDGDGIAGYRDPACCGGGEPSALSLARVRLVRRGSGSELRFTAVVPAGSSLPAGADVFLQVEPETGSGFSAYLPGDRFKKKGKTLRFKDKGTVASAAGVGQVTLQPKSGDRMKVVVFGKQVLLATPPPGDVQVTVAFVAAQTSGAGLCFTAARPLKGKGKVVHFP